MPERAYPDITAVILAGGRGQRFGGCDKGLIRLAGKPLIEHVLRALTSQAGEILISAGPDRPYYSDYGYPVIADRGEGYQGPLAGLYSALLAARTRYLLSVPCDSPLVPVDLALRLHTALTGTSSALAVAHDGVRMQYLCALLSHTLAPSLGNYLAQGGRKVADWINSCRPVIVDFSDQPEAFANVNTPQQLRSLASTLPANPAC